MARLYADEQFPRPVVEYLRRLGHDVLTVQAAGISGKPDLEVLSFAIADQRAVLTQNRRDFVKLHQFHPDFDRFPLAQINPQESIEKARPPGEAQNQTPLDRH